MVASITDIQTHEKFKRHDNGDYQPPHGRRVRATAAIVGVLAVAGGVFVAVHTSGESTGSHAPQGIEAAAGPTPLLDGTGGEVLTNVDGSWDDVLLYPNAELHDAMSPDSSVVEKVKPGQVGLIHGAQKIHNTNWIISTYQNEATGQTQVVYFDSAIPGSQTKSSSTALYKVYKSPEDYPYKPTFYPEIGTLELNHQPVGGVYMLTNEQATAQLIEDGYVAPPARTNSVTA